ncbi:3'-5' exonuclease [Streptomyces scopuliridis]|uniref:3'-5' exonuclease n=1 Tax=Streptomyces scopuliridis TaxID=452529 RepID=UPI00342E379F
MTPLAFLDTETTHLNAELGDAWEVAVILREFDDNEPTDTEYVWQIRPNLATADPEALKIGRYLERFAVPPHAEAAWTGYEHGPVLPMKRSEVADAILNVLRGAVLIGSNPGFDDRFLRKLLGPGSAQWHYRPYDIVQLAAAKVGLKAAGPLPWSSYDMSRAVGVEPPTKGVAHTALGDCRWVRDFYNAITKETLNG